MSPYYIVMKRGQDKVILAARISNFRKGVTYDKKITIFEVCSYFDGVDSKSLSKGIHVGDYRCIKFNNSYRLIRMTCGDIHIVSTTLRRLVDCQICSLIDYCKINEVEALHQIQ